MAATSLAKKLAIKPGQRMLVIDAPEGYLQLLEPLPEGSTLGTIAGGHFDWVQAFLRSKTDAERIEPVAFAAAAPGAYVWLVYPKQSSQIKSDINRDILHAAMREYDWEGVTLISIDETWSSMRYRPAAEVKSRNRAT